MPDDALYRDYRDRILGFIRARVSDPADAEDLVQEVFLRAYRKLPELHAAQRVVPWLFTIARNAVIDFYRMRNPAAAASSVPAAQDIPQAVPDAAAGARREVASWLIPTIAKLPDPYRRTLRLAEIEELPYASIAGREGISLSAVKSRVRRGRRMMRQLIEACCRIHLDRQGRVYDYDPPPACCRTSI